MRKLFLSSLASLLLLAASAQVPERSNSREIIASGIKLHDAGSYKAAIEQYQTISRNDTNYALSLYEAALSYRADSNFTKALQTCEAALALPANAYEMQILNTYGSVFDDLGNTERALRIYDSALIKFPEAQLLRLNKGISLVRAEKLQEAEAIFKDLIMRNPYYASAHYRLAQCALQKGEVVPAMFSLFTYLLINPSGAYNTNATSLLSNISKGNSEVMTFVDARTSSDETFSAAEQIVLSKIALDKAYKTKTDLDDPIIRQLQVAIEKTTYSETDKNFWMQVYVPLYTAIYKEGYFEPLVYHAFSNVDLESIQRYVKKNTKEIKSATSFVVNYLNTIRNTRELQASRRNDVPLLYHFNDDAYFGTGKLNTKGGLAGNWTFYHTNGAVKSIGSYTADGAKDGFWKYYTENGQLLGTDSWVGGKQTGEDLLYNTWNVISAKATYRNGLLHGEKESFYGIGHLYAKSTYTDGKQNGPFTDYYSNGRRKTVAFYKNDALDGPYKTYHQNGRVATEASYSNGKFDGAYKVYYDNGQLHKTGTYETGKLNGEEREYHTNGRLKKKHTYVNDLLDGDALEYNSDSMLIEKVPYKGGKAHGLAEYYASDGILFSTFLFEKGSLKTARYFNKAGNEISKSERQNKAIELSVYNPEGLLSSKTTYNDRSEKKGTDTYFYTSGKIRETNQYQDGLLHGISTGYYANGAKEYEIHYAEDEKDGLSTYYYQNGNVKSTGWYDKGQLNDTWTIYNEKGNVTSRTPYLSDDITGYQESFYANGKLYEEEVYKNGWLLACYQYDTTGKRIHTVEFKNATGLCTGIHFNGKPSYEAQYQQGRYQGVYKAYYFDGSPSFIKNYDSGLLHGAYTDYYYGGKIAATGQYNSDERSGTWKFYTEEGTMHREETYTNGELNGTRTYYYSNGKPERVFEYKNDEREGTMMRYASDGQLSGVFYYTNDRITGYTYNDKNGKLLPVKPLPGGNGNVLTYYSNGNKSAEMEYKAGLLVGAHRLYHANGNLYYETTEDYNLVNGPLKEYYENGTRKKEYVYVSDKEEGPYKEYHPNGTVKEEGTYYNGVLNGDVSYYDTTGKRTELRTYYFGTLLKIKK